MPVIPRLLFAMAAMLRELSPGQKAGIILGGAVAGVTGMWIALYRRGKK